MNRRPVCHASGGASSGSTRRKVTASLYGPRATISSSIILRYRVILRNSLPVGKWSTKSVATTGARTREASGPWAKQGEVTNLPLLYSGGAWIFGEMRCRSHLQQTRAHCAPLQARDRSVGRPLGAGQDLWSEKLS